MDRILENFRAFLKEKEVKEIEVGDKVFFSSDRDMEKPMKVTGKRRMFASDLHAYTVEDENGRVVGEYDEKQLVKA
jgi:hypothetical protein